MRLEETRQRASAAPPRGVLRTRVEGGETEHVRLLPKGPLAPFIAHFWSVRWALDAPFTAETLPHPSVHALFEARAGHPGAQIAGVPTTRFTRELTGRGEVFGVKFRPGAFHQLAAAPMVTLTDRVVPFEALFGADGAALERAVLAAETLDAKIALAEAFFVPRLAPLSAEVAELRDLVERIATDRTLLRAADAAAALGVSPRALQRRFERYIGVTPKWVLARFRLHEAAEQLKAESPPSLAALACALGYADQAHFARDFKDVVGRTPRSFVEAERPAPLGRAGEPKR